MHRSGCSFFEFPSFSLPLLHNASVIYTNIIMRTSFYYSIKPSSHAVSRVDGFHSGPSSTRSVCSGLNVLMHMLGSSLGHSFGSLLMPSSSVLT